MVLLIKSKNSMAENEEFKQIVLNHKKKSRADSEDSDPLEFDKNQKQSKIIFEEYDQQSRFRREPGCNKREYSNEEIIKKIYKLLKHRSKLLEKETLRIKKDEKIYIEWKEVVIKMYSFIFCLFQTF